MIIRKLIILQILIAVSLLTVSCNKSSVDETAVSLLKNIYEVRNYEAYEKVSENMKSYISKEIKKPITEGIVSLDVAIAIDIYMPYFEEYYPYTTEKCLESLFSQGLATYMDELAYSNEFYTEVEGVDLEERKTTSENPEYKYTVRLKFIKGDKSISGEGSGIIGFEKIGNEEYKVNFIKRTDSKAIYETLMKLSNS